jgi:2-oxo-4-hydroxy-4-carboxy-5-ureidoimidazoline decarboxylase
MIISSPTETALRRFNALSDEQAHADLLACCASPTWAQRVAAGRPYATSEDLLAAVEAACHDLSDDDLRDALAAHPRIGDRAAGQSTEAEWSRQEQALVGGADADVREQLHAGNLAYEDRFGHVFLIRAAGRSAAEMLAELRRRLGNDPATEWREVAEQLCEITRMRVERMLSA